MTGQSSGGGGSGMGDCFFLKKVIDLLFFLKVELPPPPSVSDGVVLAGPCIVVPSHCACKRATYWYWFKTRDPARWEAGFGAGIGAKHQRSVPTFSSLLQLCRLWHKEWTLEGPKASGQPWGSGVYPPGRPEVSFLENFMRNVVDDFCIIYIILWTSFCPGCFRLSKGPFNISLVSQKKPIFHQWSPQQFLWGFALILETDFLHQNHLLTHHNSDPKKT